MTKKVDEVQKFDADPETVFAMLTDKDYIVWKSEQSAALEAVAEVVNTDDGVRIHNRRVLPAKVPGFVQKFLGDTIPLDETQVWGHADSDGSRAATFSVDFDGQPLAFSGTIRLAPDGDGTSVRTQGDLKCSVPLIGGKVEGFAQEWIDKFLVKEQRLGNQWLAEH